MSQTKPNPNLFKSTPVGRICYKPLKHKNGEVFDDVDYFELLGRKCIEMDKENKNPAVPTNYGDYDRDVVNVAKEVVKALDNGFTKKEVQDYLTACIDINK